MATNCLTLLLPDMARYQSPPDIAGAEPLSPASPSAPAAGTCPHAESGSSAKHFQSQYCSLSCSPSTFLREAKSKIVVASGFALFPAMSCPLEPAFIVKRIVRPQPAEIH